jgi:hypothetical protein
LKVTEEGVVEKLTRSRRRRAEDTIGAAFKTIAPFGFQGIKTVICICVNIRLIITKGGRVSSDTQS